MSSSIWIHAAIENVWQAITEEQSLSQWYAPGSTWDIPKLAEGEKMIFTLMPNDHNQLADPLPMQLTIQQVQKHEIFSFYLEVPETVIAMSLAEQDNGITVSINMQGYEASLANLKALLEGDDIPNQS
ncbi:SRPBCC domain-containing protein [Lysinibacillus fusiformis]|uniref:SRPBCC domain-containing protein n=1 Tax=Lysinibacillus fusiformis TaxID=28031 RepID=UPI00263A8AA6|nr:SRPBCC domain-containing protein [Lysinibacillus fusiformis]MDC6266437.1 SRPBCC domain-containing protein [Lysinibacillus sphaericus]MDN4970311.1 SRPBCC domain-containing protein [Lysinibacillus fusiformis]